MLKRKTQQSRLNRTSVRQNNKQALYFGVAFVVLIIGLIQFGPFLINVFGNIIYSIRGDKSEAQIVGKEILQPPTLYNIPSATQSAYVNFNGNSTTSDGTIEIYVNDELEKEVELNGSSDFEAKRIPLTSGENTIKARLVAGKDTSAFSEDYSISYLKEGPKLEVTAPSNGGTFTRADRKINVAGKTDPDNSVTVNAFRAIVDGSGSFSYLLELKDGENTITVEARNPAGITTQTELKVTYNP